MDVDMPSQASSSSSSSCSSEFSYYLSSTYTNHGDGSYSSEFPEMDGHIQEVKLEKIVKVSFGLTDEEVEAIKRATWTLPQEPFKQYKSKVRAGAPKRQRYQYIQAILEGVVAQIRQGKPGFDIRTGDHSTALLYVEMDGTRRLKAEGVSRVPDGWLSWTRETKVGWNTIKAALEINVICNKDVKQELSKSCKSASMQKAASESAAMALRRSSASTSATASTSMVLRRTVVSAGAKRRRDEAEDSQAIDLPNKKIRTPPRRGPNNKTIRPALYALEPLTSCCRRWTFVLSIDNYTVMLWYFDRMGAICSVGFEFNLEAHTWKLALILAGLYRCTPAMVGFEPLIVSPRAAIDTQTHWPIFVFPLSDFANAEVVVPRSISQLAADDKRYRVDTGELLYTSWGIIGRGTTVIPVRPLPSTGNSDDRLLVVKISSPSLIHPVLESTMIRRLRQRLGNMRKHMPKILQARVFSLMHMNYPRFSLGHLVDEPRRFTLVVMRRYRPLWEITSLEDFKNVFVDLVECHYHAFKVGRVSHRDLSENNLMWTYEEEGDCDGDGDEVYETFPAECEGRDWEDERRIAEEGDGEETSIDTQSNDQDSKDGEHDDDEDISKLNYDLKEALPVADTASGPIPMLNKVSVPSENASTRNTAAQPKKGGKAIGILGDWDLGSLVQDNNTVDRSTANHRTGTLPFMARDLLNDDPPPHLSRHELESFFYALIWAMVHYRLDGTRRARADNSTHPVLSAFESSLDSNCSKKDAIFGNQDSLQLVIDCVQDPFQPLINEWVYPLCDMFAAGFSARNDYLRYLRSLDPNTKPVPFNNLDLGGHITFEAFMKAIGQEPRIFKSK